MPLIIRVINSISLPNHLLPLIKLLQYFTSIWGLDINLANRQCALALLLTPAENQWLASELTIFLDRALRRQQIYREALDRLTVTEEILSETAVD